MERIYNKIDTKVLSEINKTTEIVAISVAIASGCNWKHRKHRNNKSC